MKTLTLMMMSCHDAAPRAPRSPRPPDATKADKPAKAAAKKPGKTSVAGIRTVFLPSPANPLVALRVFFQVGSVDDPKGKEGLAR